jgi:Proteasome subunit
MVFPVTVTRACRYSGKLQIISTDEPRVSMEYLCRFLQNHLYGGDADVYLIIGGFLRDGTPCLRELYPHGSMNEAAFTALGSGGMAALAVLEDGYDQSLSLAEAVDLAVTAVKAGIQHDLGSGSQVDVCVLRPNRPAAFSRAVVPAEELPNLMNRVTTAPQVTTDTETANNVLVPRGGVNGFGNVNFVVRSRKQLCRSSNLQTQQILDHWKDILPTIQHTK